MWQIHKIVIQIKLNKAIAVKNPTHGEQLKN